ncbi:MAG: hypothetical protein HY657_04075 [Acidobacteria bacterium]|nr:hypothetical protein [Acidobacteriota bacterium]
MERRKHSCALCLTVTLAGVVALPSGLSEGPVAAQSKPEREARPERADDSGLQVLPVRDSERYGRVHMIAGAGANITVQTTGRGIVLVDAGTADMAEEVLATLHGIASDKVVWAIVNTSGDADKTGGVATIAQAGNNILRGVNDPGAQVIAHENVLSRMSQEDAPVLSWPTDTFFVTMWTLPSFYYGDGIQINHFPRALTNGDSMVWFRRADVIATGDIFRTDTYPVIDLAHGGNVKGVIDGLNWVIETAIASQRAEGGTLIVPGHGRLSDRADVVYYRDMVTIVRDRMKDMISRGMTLEQIRSAGPTLDYDGRYGETTGPWTTDMFVESVYGSLIE